MGLFLLYSKGDTEMPVDGNPLYDLTRLGPKKSRHNGGKKKITKAAKRIRTKMAKNSKRKNRK